eukprot:XP_025013298.1 probable WRKY transcription factor 72 isoform X1 [Ricinus communis]
METDKSGSLEKPDHCANTAAVQEEKKMKSSGDDEEVVVAEINKEEGDVNHVINIKQEENIRKRPSSTMNKDLTSINHEDQLRSTKAKIGEVKEENERLKQLLSKILNDYQSLQKHFCKVVQEEEEKKPAKLTTAHQKNQEPELVSLSLGRSSSSEPKKEEKKSSNLSDGNEDDELNNKGLSLGLDCKFEPDSSVTVKNNASSENSFDEDPKEEEPTETWSPNKIRKTTITPDDEAMQQNQIKKTRVSVRARCDTPTMNDGCQWRKYGQKIAKGNPCPRAYYRCTASPTCPVRKQVQRCAKDMSVLITTYEGTHNHPLPLSATAMASTTSAAASMIQSRSSTSAQPGSSISAPSSISTSNGLNFSLSQNSRPQQIYFPNSSISTSNSHPTVTLDLTTAPSTTTAQYFNRFSSAPRCLNFSSSPSSTSLDQSNINTLQSLWNPSSYSTYGTVPLNRNYVEKQPTPGNHHVYQPYMHIINSETTPPPNQQSLTESIAAATKMITSNPNFRSALAAAITSFVGNNGGSTTTTTTTTNSNNSNNPGAGEHYSGLNLKLGDHHQSLAFNTLYPSSNSNGIGCASSYLNKSATSLSSQQGSLVLFPGSLPFSSATRSASESPANSRDHNKG